MKLFLRQAETRVLSNSQCLLYADGLGRGRKQARPAPADLVLSSQEARRALAPGQARGLLIPCFNLTSIIRMPDSASNVKRVLVRGQR